MHMENETICCNEIKQNFELNIIYFTYGFHYNGLIFCLVDINYRMNLMATALTPHWCISFFVLVTCMHLKEIPTKMRCTHLVQSIFSCLQVMILHIPPNNPEITWESYFFVIPLKCCGEVFALGLVPLSRFPYLS